jgi:hypothetical protein
MKEIKIKKYVRYFFGISVLLFVLNKLYLRSWILDHDFSGITLLITKSIPNLLEAVMGTLLLTGILLQINQSFLRKNIKIKPIFMHCLAVILTAGYVISQELKFHNLGGNNVYDINDLMASLIGLVSTFTIIRLFGFVDENEI